MTILWNTEPQGSEGWLAARRGAITGSRAKDARDKLKNGSPSKAALDYAMDCARERCGGRAAPVFVNAAMRMGTEQEPIARERYEDETNSLVIEVGFAHTEDGKFGCSVDGLIDDDGIWSCKTMVSSATLFKAMVDGDISEYIDQALFEMWLLSRRWVDLSLWCPDLQRLHTIRIARDEAKIEALEADLIAFEQMVSEYEAALRKAMAPSAPVPETAASGKPAADMDAPWDMSSVGVTPKPALEPTF